MKQRWIKKMTALALVFIFTGQQIVTAQAPAPANELLRAKPLSLFSSRPSLELPAELGTVVDQFGDKPSLVLIQDAHGHTEAQRNTAQLLRMLHETEKFDALFLEGGIGNLKADRLKLLKIDSENLELADALLTQSDIGGAEHFLLGELIRAGKELPSYGLENPALYFKNLRNYQDTVSSESLSQKWLEGDWIRLRQNAAKVLNPALAEFYKQWMGYARQDDLMRALPVLEHASRKVIGVDFRDARAQIEWPMMTRVAELKRREKKLSAEKSEKEWMRLTDWVRSQGDTGKTLLRVLEDKEFFKKEAVWNERFKIASRRAFWEKLYEIMSPRGFDFKQYPNLSLWEGAKILESELEAEALMAEIRRLENSILEHLSGKPEEKEIIRQTKKNLLIEKLFTLQLTRDEFQVLSREKNVLNEPGLKNALHFYQAALSRDRVMAENAARIMAKNKIKKAVIIAGGFHTEAFTSSLKRKNISYAVVRPHLSVIESEHAYQDVMMGKLPSAPLAVSTLRAFSWINAPRYFNRLPAANRRRHDAVLKPLGAVRSRSEVRNEEEVTEKNSVRDGYSRSQRDRKLRFLVEDEDLIFDVLAKKPNRLFSFSEFLDEIGSERPKHFTPILLSMKGERETFKSKQDGINYRMIIRSDKGRVLSVGAIREQTVPIYQGLEKIILGNNTESSGLTEGERDFLNGLESSRNRPLALEALEFIISMFDQKEIITNEKTREFVLKLDEALTDDTPIYKFLNENGKLIRRLKPRGGGKKADDQNGQAEPASKLRKLDQKFYNLSELEEWILKDFVLFPLFRDNPTRIDLYEKLAKRKGDLRAAFDNLAKQGFMLKKIKGKTGIANTYEITDLGERMEALISARSEARAEDEAEIKKRRTARTIKLDQDFRELLAQINRLSLTSDKAARGLGITLLKLFSNLGQDIDEESNIARMITMMRPTVNLLGQNFTVLTLKETAGAANRYLAGLDANDSAVDIRRKEKSVDEIENWPEYTEEINAYFQRYNIESKFLGDSGISKKQIEDSKNPLRFISAGLQAGLEPYMRSWPDFISLIKNHHVDSISVIKHASGLPLLKIRFRSAVPNKAEKKPFNELLVAVLKDPVPKIDYSKTSPSDYPDFSSLEEMDELSLQEFTFSKGDGWSKKMPVYDKLFELAFSNRVLEL